MFTLSRIQVVPAIVFGLSLAVAHSAGASNIYDTMSSEEIADHQSQQLGQQEGQIVQPQPVDETQLASAARTLSAEEFARGPTRTICRGIFEVVVSVAIVVVSVLGVKAARIDT